MTDNTVPAPDPHSGLEAGRKAEDAIWNRPGVDDLSGSRLHALERRADEASAAAEITVAAGGGQFQLHLDHYEQTYADLYDLHKRLDAARDKAMGARDSLRAMSQQQPVGRLSHSLGSWNDVCAAADNVGKHADHLSNQIKAFLWSMHDTKVNYANTERQNVIPFGKGASST